MAELLSFEDGVKRINAIAEGLAGGTFRSRGKIIIELRRLCGHHRTVPDVYKLEGVVKEGTLAQSFSRATEIWKGRYMGQEVALKILNAPREDPDSQKTKSRFCKEVVLMKHTHHKNVIPLYGVSMTISDFCLVFPWYHNGDIVDYVQKNPDANRYDLLLGAINGLSYMHSKNLVHGALRPDHVLIDDDGNARLATAGRSSILPAPDSSTADHAQSALDGGFNNFRYVAPEIQWPEEYGKDQVLISKYSDVYEMAMVIYEVLTEQKPYSGCNNTNILLAVQTGEIPERPPGEISDLVWELLERCWSRTPGERPSATELHNTLSNLLYRPQTVGVTQTPHGRQATGGLPSKLKLQVQDIAFTLDNTKKRQFYVKLRYGNNHHATSTTCPVDGTGDYAWKNAESWTVEVNKQYYKQIVSLEVFIKMGLLKKDKVCATGNFSLLNNVNKQIPVKLEALDSAGSAVLKVMLIEAQ